MCTCEYFWCCLQYGRSNVYMLWRIASEGHGNKRVQQINKMCIAYVNTPVHLILVIHRIFWSGFLHLFSNPFNIQDLSIDILSYLHWCSTLKCFKKRMCFNTTMSRDPTWIQNISLMGSNSTPVPITHVEIKDKNENNNTQIHVNKLYHKVGKKVRYCYLYELDLKWDLFIDYSQHFNSRCVYRKSVVGP